MKFNYSQTAVLLHMQLPLYFDVGRQEEKLFFFLNIQAFIRDLSDV